MVLAGINWLAVLVASFAAFVAGGLWFGPKTFFPVWWKAMGRDPNEKPGVGMNMGVVFGSTYVAQLAQATTLAVIVNTARVAAGPAPFGLVEGAITGLVVGVGLAAFSSLSHRLFGGFGFKVWVLEVASDVVNLTIVGAILGAWK